MSLDVSRAERALHRRAALACEAALAAGVAGRFRAWDEAGVMAVLATDPALGFLSTVSGIARETVSTTIDLVNAPVWDDVRPTVVVSAELGETVEALLPAAGLVRAGDRLLAVKRLDARPAAQVDVFDAGEDDTFLDVLLAGYGTDGVVAEAGCALAVATARPDSVSAANLRRAGFRIHRRSAWTKV